MIYIYTTKTDLTVNCVIDWLVKYGMEYFRVNSDEFFKLFEKGKHYFSDTDVHWFWKWNTTSQIMNNYFINSYNDNALNSALNRERKVLFDLYFENYVKKAINHPKYVEVNKLSQIETAINCGFKVPNTIITVSRDILGEFLLKHKFIITKCINSSLNLALNNKTYKSFATKVNMEDIKQLPQTFFPSLFQEYIQREFEIRVIYCGGMIYSIALFASKEDGVDIGSSINNKSIEYLPYNLPDYIEKKICNLMDELQLQIGSIDLIYSNKGDYIFLEVNPSGQFIGYSNQCNYCIEKNIAKYLKNIQNEKNQ